MTTIDQEKKEKQKKYSTRTNAKKGYYAEDGKRVVGVTTVLNNVSKNGLIHWAWELGIDGVDYNAYRDEMADIGKLSHKFCLEPFVDPDEFEKPVLSDYSPFVIKMAKSGLRSWRKWIKQNPTFTTLFAERGLVSEQYRFGGRPDWYGTIDRTPGKHTRIILDLKFQPKVYEESFFQTAAYAQLCVENGFPVDQIVILRMDRVGAANYDEIVINDWSIYLDCFLSLLNFHEMRKLSRKQNA